MFPAVLKNISLTRRRAEYYGEKKPKKTHDQPLAAPGPPKLRPELDNIGEAPVPTQSTWKISGNTASVYIYLATPLFYNTM